MKILTLRTDKPEAELGVYEDNKKIAYETWQAHRELAETIHKKLEEILNKSNIELNQLEGVVVFEGPGSFTGLRIGLSVANALAYSLNVPIVAVGGKSWADIGIEKINSGQNDKIALPKYGGHIKTTKPCK